MYADINHQHINMNYMAYVTILVGLLVDIILPLLRNVENNWLHYNDRVVETVDNPNDVISPSGILFVLS